MIMVVLKLRAAAGYMECFRSALEGTSAVAEAMPGCIESSVYQAADDYSHYLYFQLWSSCKDLNGHLRSESFKKLLTLIELSEEAPALNFYDIVAASSIEAVAAARSETEH